uniref:Peptidase A2 domain-containing protein n=1 Tax=Steinernema glaseri TaxID=37863 RepID=A0A1I7XYE4_9BILA
MQGELQKSEVEYEEVIAFGGYVPTLVLTVNELFVRGLMDTGASISIIAQGALAKIMKGPERLQSVSGDRQCIASNGQPLKVLGEVRLPVAYLDNEVEQFRFVVTADNFGHDMIIGSDLLRVLGFQFYNVKNNEFHTQK